MPSKKVLITGANGALGGAIYRRLSEQPEKFDAYGMDRRRSMRSDLLSDWTPVFPPGKMSYEDVANLDNLIQTVRGKSVVIHMAAETRPDSAWDSVLRCNLVGTYNVLEACRLAGVRRLIFASSIRVSFGYANTEPYKAILEDRIDAIPERIPLITSDMPVSPIEPYGASKVWGEALARVYASQHGISCICLRIGGISPRGLPFPPPAFGRANWCSFRDLTQLVERCIEAPDDLGFDIFYAVSNNRYRWVDIERARQAVGYSPQDRGEDCRLE